MVRNWRSASWLCIGSALFLGVGLLGNSTLAASTITEQSFATCATQLQQTEGGPIHMLTLTEAVTCGPGLPELSPQAVVAAVTLPSSFLVVSGSTAAFEQISSSPTESGSATPDTCTDTWTYPSASWFDGLDWGSFSGAGYGNHCDYANVPSTPTVEWGCICTGHSFATGHYSSTWGEDNYGQNWAVGWANLTFTFPAGADSWDCRLNVSTTGTQSPAPYCE